MSGPASRVSRVLMTGPLAPFAEAYAAELRGRGYTSLTTVNELRQVGRVSRWLESRGLSAAELSVERVELFLIWQRAGGRHRAEWSRPGLLCLLGCWTVSGCSTTRSLRRRALRSICCWRRLSGTWFPSGVWRRAIVGYVRHARWFVEGLGGMVRPGSRPLV